MSPRTVAVIQARMGSSRLPGKVLMDIEGVPMLGRVVSRVRRAARIQDVIVATTTDAADNGICDYCKKNGTQFMRGSQFDVLDRYFQAARQTKAEIVVRITADCPVIDHALIDEAVKLLLGDGSHSKMETGAIQPDFDFVANRLPPPWRRTYPIGLDTEVCTFKALEQAWAESSEPVDREHVMPYLYQGVKLAPENPHVSIGTTARGFRVAILEFSEDLGRYRWTVDAAGDLEFVREVYRRLGEKADFSWLDVLQLLRSSPELMSINANVRHKSLRDVDERATGPRRP